ncbi:hypothetical protein SALBM311S_02490 [Streptomyces alboniger]
MLGEVRAPGRSTRTISGQSGRSGWRLTTRSKVASAKGNGASSDVATTATPRGRSRAVALATFGGQTSVAAVSTGAFGAAARAKSRTSPPPVWMSSAADAPARRPAIDRAYPHEGRASVARPSNQEKSHPSVGTAAPSATRSSKVRGSGGVGSWFMGGCCTGGWLMNGSSQGVVGVRS